LAGGKQVFKDSPKVLTEGIADYLEHYSDHKFNAQGLSIDKTEAAGSDLREILKLEYSTDDEKDSLVYRTGHALVMYLQEKDPSLLRDYLEALRKGDLHKLEDLLSQIKGQDDAFKGWLAENNTDTAMEKINALQVTKGDFIATGQEIVDKEIKNVSYYKADIKIMDGEKVGSFSPVEHVAFYDVARAINRATNDNLDISKEYHFLKVIRTDGQNKLVYSDENGNEYRSSQEYKNQAFKILSKYDTEIKSQVDKFDSLNKERGEMYQKYHRGEIDIEKLRDEENTKYRPAFLKFNQLKNKAVDEIKDNPQVTKILDELVNINPNLVRSTNHIDLQEGEIFSIKALGQGNMGALSIYDGKVKLGELLSESGFFKQVKGQTKETFFFEDILHNLNVRYDGGAYMAVTKENGHHKASLIDGRIVERDEYFDEAHLHANEFLHPSVRHIQGDLDSLLLRGSKILNHQDSEHAQYSNEQRENGVIVEKGELLDNKGTDRTDDDVYEAVVKQKGKHSYEFKNVGFYISEKGDLFIHDHGANVRFQLPKSITHLKLVQEDGGYKLVPADERGNECRYDTRGNDILDEYKYIDPIFAHEYEKRDYSHKHVNIGLVNFDKYSTGKLFAIKYDPNDYYIQKNSKGEIVRINGQTYFTKVKLFDGDEEIGVLSNNFHNFKGKIFFSADYSYSYSDFLASVSPRVEIEDMGDGGKRITFGQGSGDIGDTDKGYTDYQRIFTTEKQTKSPKGQSGTKTEVDESHMSHSTTNVVAQAAEEKAASNDNDEMQSDQPQISTRAKRSALVEEEQEQVVLKDTILKIEKSSGQVLGGKHKANITIDYNDVKALYDKAEGAEKQSVLKFWHKLAESGCKVGALPEDKYYFQDGKFIIRDSGTKKCIALPEDKVSIKIIKDGDHYDLAISNKEGKVISSITKIDNLNYELLSDTSGVSLETQDSASFSDQHNEYSVYLENGLGEIFNCASDYAYHDHNSFNVG